MKKGQQRSYIPKYNTKYSHPHVSYTRPHPTSRGHRRVATLWLGVAQKPPPSAPPKGQQRLHLNTKTKRVRHDGLAGDQFRHNINQLKSEIIHA